MTSKSAPLGVRNVERPRPLRSVSHIGIPASSTNMANAGMNDDRRMSAQDVGSGIVIYLNSSNFDRELTSATRSPNIFFSELSIV